MRRRTFVASAAAVGAFGVAGCAETDPGDETTTSVSTATPTTGTLTFAAEPVVTVTEHAFNPRTLRVRPGTEVTWTNEGDDSHTVQSEVFNPDVATDWRFYSADLVSGASVSHTFEKSGVYEYYCTAHGETEMCGVVLVGGVEYAASLPCEE